MLKDIIVRSGMLGQGSDMEGWVDLLVILVLAVLWAIGGLVKVGRSKAAQRRQREGPANVPQRAPRESWQQRLARKAEEVQRAAEAKGKEMAHRLEEHVGQRRQGGQPARPAGKVTIRRGPRGESVMVYERPEPELAMDRERRAAGQRQAQAAVTVARRAAIKEPPPSRWKVETVGPGYEPIGEGLAGVALEPAKSLEMGASRESAGFESAAVIDYDDPDALKKAVLHYEILGRPIALREPSEQMPAF